MAKVSKSVVREIGADEIRAFSSFDDYVTALISEGLVKSSQDLVSRRPDLLGSILFKWYQQGQVACLYARMLAMKPETQWPSITIQGTVDVEQLEEQTSKSVGTKPVSSCPTRRARPPRRVLLPQL